METTQTVTTEEIDNLAGTACDAIAALGRALRERRDFDFNVVEGLRAAVKTETYAAHSLIFHVTRMVRQLRDEERISAQLPQGLAQRHESGAEWSESGSTRDDADEWMWKGLTYDEASHGI